MTEKKEFKKIFAEGIAMYPFIHTPKKAFNAGDPPQYSLDLIVDDKNAKILMDAGLKPAKTMVNEDTKKPKEYPEYPGQKVFSLRKKTKTKDGKDVKPPSVVDSTNAPIPENILIGNGSRVRVAVNPYTVMFQGRSVNGHSMLGVQVLDLIEYQAMDTGFEPTEGYKVPEAPLTTFSDTDEPW